MEEQQAVFFRLVEDRERQEAKQWAKQRRWVKRHLATDEEPAGQSRRRPRRAIKRSVCHGAD
jgi:hypothetical protein